MTTGRINQVTDGRTVHNSPIAIETAIRKELLAPKHSAEFFPFLHHHDDDRGREQTPKACIGENVQRSDEKASENRSRSTKAMLLTKRSPTDRKS